MTTSPPYQVLIDQLRAGKVVPFLGAGASVSVSGSNPSTAHQRPPTAGELARHLGKTLGLNGDDVGAGSLLEVASTVELFHGRDYLDHALADLFAGFKTPGSIHRLLAQSHALRLIVTTNYDTLIEEAFYQAGRKFQLIMTPTHSRDVRRQLLWWGPGNAEPLMYADAAHVELDPGIPIIYKMHGGIDPGGRWHSCVVTEDDYFEIGGRIYESSFLPPAAAHMLLRNRILFLGYSLRDVHVRHMVRGYGHVVEHLNLIITKDVSKFDQLRFQQYGLHVYDLDLNEFARALQS